MTTKHEAYTHHGWVPCLIKRSKYRKKKEGDKTTRVLHHHFVQLLPAKNVVKRWPEQVRESD